MNVTVFGLGFVGVTTALGLAHLGHQVYGIEISPDRRRMLSEGTLPFYEPHMEDELKLQLSERRFVLDKSIEEAVACSEVIFYCVGTPYGPGGAADLTFLMQTVDQTLAAVKDERFRVLVTKSTIPPSTTELRIAPYVAANAPEGADLCVANNPEFLREGFCWQDFIEADRIVIGCGSQKGCEKMKALYEPLGAPIFCVSPSTGEFIKYLSNSLLATLISYSNEMAEMAEGIGGIQAADAFRILHMDRRWTNGGMASYAYPGCGYGGYCLPKDTCALRALAQQNGMQPDILDAVIKTNEGRSRKIAERIASGMRPEQTIGIAGLAFKPGTDDVRESPASRIIKELSRMGYCNILACDPMAVDPFKKANANLKIRYCKDLDDLCEQSDCIAITTAWPEYAELAHWAGRVIDCRYML